MSYAKRLFPVPAFLFLAFISIHVRNGPKLLQQRPMLFFHWLDKKASHNSKSDYHFPLEMTGLRETQRISRNCCTCLCLAQHPIKAFWHETTGFFTNPMQTWLLPLRSLRHDPRSKDPKAVAVHAETQSATTHTALHKRPQGSARWKVNLCHRSHGLCCLSCMVCHAVLLI